ncbi:hypothetical protein DM860_001005 [Cuscuta australis]|uniref:DUF4283 domain-containing protein n=1 Tax=Cuscuta australis TaxID=267555 RepID=A0A328DSK5_9ASTE|nr:hypothetical protein DM860_001005 [Cuscuta australis]
MKITHLLKGDNLTPIESKGCRSGLMGSRELHNLNDRIAALGISEDDEGISFAQTEDAQMTGALPQIWTIAGRFLTDKPIKFEVMQQVLASVWRPAMGVRISQASSGIYLVNFCYG